MKNSIICIFVFFTTVLSAGAQEAKKLLDEVSQKVRSYENIVLDFKYALSNEVEDVSQETRGDVSLAGNKYRLNIMGTNQIFDGTNLYIIIPEDEEVNISKQNESDDTSVTPSKMLTFYESGYNFKMDISQNVKGRKIQYVKLTPIDAENNEMQELLLGIDSQTKNIYKLIQKQKNGTQIIITVQDFKTNQPLSKTLFTFDESKYEDYYINRLD